jgi:hypothetical protein
MSGSKKKFLYVMIILVILAIVAGIVTSLVAENSGIVPLFGLPNQYHIIVTNLVWPVLGSMICALLFPRLFAPIFLALKKYIMPDFKNGEIAIETKPYRLRKWFGRAVYVSLLVLGLQALLTGFFPHELLLTPADLAGYEGLGMDIRFVLGVTTGIVGLLTPLAVGLLSIGWAMEDAGLVHYDLPEESDRIYEVEPIFRRYISYLKGYAGFSSLIFLISLILYLGVLGPERYIDVFFTIVMPFQAILYSAFGYLAYVQTNTKFLKGRYPSVGRITEDEIQS